MSASPHITAVERQAKLKRLAAERFRVTNGKVEKYTVDFSAQNAKDAIAAARAAEDAKLQVGEKAGDSIYLGVWEPRDREGGSLGKIFNVFAAPQDLPDAMKYSDTVKHIAGLKNWNGADGTDYADDEEIRAALADGSYNGGWFIPPRELLTGIERDSKRGIRKGKVIQPVNLFDHKNKGAFRDTFKTEAGFDNEYPSWYWSSTYSRNNASGIWNADFRDCFEIQDTNDNYRQSCRPVRLELKP